MKYKITSKVFQKHFSMVSIVAEGETIVDCIMTYFEFRNKTFGEDSQMAERMIVSIKPFVDIDNIDVVRGYAKDPLKVRDFLLERGGVDNGMDFGLTEMVYFVLNGDIVCMSLVQFRMLYGYMNARFYDFAAEMDDVDIQRLFERLDNNNFEDDDSEE